MIGECAFEPDATPILCVECEKPTGLTGTCQDVDFCASCKQELIDGAMADGASRQEAERRYSAMLIGMIEGRPYKIKYVTRRVMHLRVEGRPACGIKGGPHPMTANPNESNCKRCLKSESANKRKAA